MGNDNTHWRTGTVIFLGRGALKKILENTVNQRTLLRSYDAELADDHPMWFKARQAHLETVIATIEDVLSDSLRS